jgi:hypothetical protein
MWFTDSVEEDVSSVLGVDEDSDLLGEALMVNMMRLLEKDNPGGDSNQRGVFLSLSVDFEMWWLQIPEA